MLKHNTSKFSETLTFDTLQESEPAPTTLSSPTPHRPAPRVPITPLAPVISSLRARRKSRPAKVSLDQPLKTLATMARMPKILAGCYATGLETGGEIAAVLSEKFDVVPGNVRQQVTRFLQGELLSQPRRKSPGEVKLTLTAVRIAEHLDVPLREAFANFAIPEYAYRNLPQAPAGISEPLESFPLLKRHLRPLKDALKRQGIETRNQLVKKLVEFGVRPEKASFQLRETLSGKIFSDRVTNRREFTATAEAVSRAAGLPPEIAFAQLLDDRARREAELPPALKDRPLRGRPSRPLEEVEILKARMPKILAACAAAGLQSVRDLKNILVETFKVSRENADFEVNEFLQGKLLMLPARQRAWPMFKRTAIRIAGHLKVPLREAYADFEIPEAAYLKLPFEPSKPLDDFEVLRTTLRPLGDALRNRGINTLGELVNGVVAKGAHPKSVYRQLAEVLEGKVFSERNGNFTVTARHLSKAAGLPPDVAFAPLLDDSWRARQEAKSPPAMKKRPLLLHPTVTAEAASPAADPPPDGAPAPVSRMQRTLGLELAPPEAVPLVRAPTMNRSRRFGAVPRTSLVFAAGMARRGRHMIPE